MKVLLIISLIGLCLIVSLQATTIHVPSQQPTIQAGINAASNFDTVLVDTGQYIENINFNGKNIVVGSLILTTGDTSYISKTVIDGDSSGSVIFFDNNEDSTAVLNGFTITNGSSDRGGGISCRSDPTLMNLYIIENVSITHGGGLFCKNSGAKILNLTITKNTALAGGGVWCEGYSSIIMTNLMIYNNFAEWGGGIFCEESNPKFIKVTLSNNTSYFGGGVYCLSSYVELINTILWNNSPEEVFFHATDDSNSITIAYSNVKDSTTRIMNNNNGMVYWLEGNIDNYPMFVDTANGDYRLQTGSPCIDTGIQDTMIVYNNGQDTLIVPPMSYLGNAPDMGAYEFDPAVNIRETYATLKQYELFQNYPNPFNNIIFLTS